MEDVQESLGTTEPKSEKKIKLIVNANYDENTNFDRFFANYLFIDHFQLQMDKIPPDLAHWQVVFPGKIHTQNNASGSSDLMDKDFDLVINSWSYSIIPNVLTRLFLELFKRDFFSWANRVAMYYAVVILEDGGESLITIYNPRLYDSGGKSIDLPSEFFFMHISTKNITKHGAIKFHSLFSQWLAYGDSELKIAKDLDWDEDKLVVPAIGAMDARITKYLKTFSK